MTGLRSISRLLMLLLTGSLVASCGIVRTGTTPAYETGTGIAEDHVDAGSLIQEGLASWYGPNFQGRLTANGEIYDMNDLTAAHKTLPFNTVVRVTNRANGKTVDVRINDRGPYVGDRIIDLSRKAALEIDMKDAGIGEVRVYLLEQGDRPVTSSTAGNRETFTVQLGSFENHRQASRKAEGISGAEVEKVNVAGREAFRVYYGTYSDRSDAENAMRELRRRGHSGFVKQKEN